LQLFQNSSQLSPNSLRISQPNSFSSSPIMAHKHENYGTDHNLDNAFIKPLPCTNDRNVAHPSIDVKVKQERLNPQDLSEIPPIILDPPPQGRRTESTVKKASTKQSSTAHATQDNKSNLQSPKGGLATILRSTGPPPSRTTSARLPSRNDVMSEMQRTTWARHTTK